MSIIVMIVLITVSVSSPVVAVIGLPSAIIVVSVFPWFVAVFSISVMMVVSTISEVI